MIPTAVSQFLNALDAELLPVRSLAERLASADDAIEPASGAVLISRRPKIAPEAYACVLYPGVGPDVIHRYEESPSNDRPIEIPRVYRTLLGRLNGASLFQIDLFGIPLSMAQDPPLLDRSTRQPLDIGTANLFWRVRYRSDLTKFHFGGGPYSPDENAGYFIDANGAVEALIRGGKRVGAWPSIQEFLVHELARAESLFVDFEQSMESVQQETVKAPDRRRRKKSEK